MQIKVRLVMSACGFLALGYTTSPWTFALSVGDRFGQRVG
jgi:hypothetical protein